MSEDGGREADSPPAGRLPTGPRPTIAIWGVGTVGIALVSVAWLLGGGLLPLVLALAASVTATALAARQLARSPAPSAPGRSAPRVPAAVETTAVGPATEATPSAETTTESTPESTPVVAQAPAEAPAVPARAPSETADPAQTPADTEVAVHPAVPTDPHVAAAGEPEPAPADDGQPDAPADEQADEATPDHDGQPDAPADEATPDDGPAALVEEEEPAAPEPPPIHRDLEIALSVAPAPFDRIDPVALGLTTTVLVDGPDAGMPGYVSRDLDRSLDEVLGPQLLAGSGGFVAVRGEPASGLTRTVFEALGRHAGRRPLLLVAPPRPLADASISRPLVRLRDAARAGALDDVPRPIVVIDDAHRHLDHGFDRDLLVELSEALPGAAIVLTLDARCLAVPEISPDATLAWLRAHSEPLAVSAELSDTELAHALERFPARSLDGRLRWLPAWCSGADTLRSRYRGARVADPIRAAVLTTAAAWQLVTGAPVVARETLLGLAGAMLGSAGPSIDHTLADLEAAITALTVDDAQLPALMTAVEVGQRAYLAVSAIVVDEVRGELPRLSAEVWNGMVDAATPAEAARIGRMAAVQGQEEFAVRALSTALDGPDAATAARAALELGVLLERLERPDSAVEAYRRVVNGGDAARAPLAAFHLGGVLEDAGEVDGAVDAYRWAAGSGDPDAGPLAAFNLGWLFEQRRQPDEAQQAYEYAVASEHPDATPMAAFNLAWIRQEQRRNREAEELYRVAVHSQHADIAPMAKVSLGMLLERLQRIREARELYEQVAASSHAEAAEAARLRLRTAKRSPGRGRR